MPIFSKKPGPPLPGGLKPGRSNFMGCFVYTKYLIAFIHEQKGLIANGERLTKIRMVQERIDHHLHTNVIRQTHGSGKRGEPWLDGFVRCYNTFEKLSYERLSKNQYPHVEAIERELWNRYVPIYDCLLPLLERLFKEIGIWRFGSEAEWAAQNGQVCPIEKRAKKQVKFDKHVDGWYYNDFDMPCTTTKGDDEKSRKAAAFKEKLAVDRCSEDILKKRIQERRRKGLQSGMVENWKEGDDEDEEEEEMRNMKVAAQEWNLLD
ncbi:hypothetical protein COCC4DRAFT_28846 [Bipolaris maydis ATCC 48331]|uniref:Uncharacterized protein n=2 Tax=Cochliobolus heterostrophus TaxID=5016 RepID=M2TEF8_COCH5|nr:uncharacterized protein COCC4DRAFT_28846 [Bipolaris maydis ATCC 48331]EMD84909.1 hypothetical protein COCHEDRAFT_1219790 [Bipolaris maydis C5]KAJ5059257.1 hypothetical protein J3E74DRAFT_290944 [Bipolaris maydis]ENH98906.1 hypothetical protein COCC4DRAFT_28846 [Bipolaris maydis ATCC 48331]KAJ6209238.1 hypothetical protein PSV09DRAFT_1219790 [Bipolaris maydis]KAJ6271739.1 hypothetical protein PSV08DRAFT_179523 [Bipolaris maydis]